MNEYNIAVVDDDAIARSNISSFLMNYSKEKGQKIKIIEFADGDEILEDYACQYNIILLDIELKRFDGMLTAKKIRELDKEVIIIFVTNCKQYALGGYSVGAMNYLVKPLSYFVFAREMDRAFDFLNRKKQDYVVIITRTGAIRVDIHDILYIESFKHKLIYHLINEEIEVYGRIKDIEEKLIKNHFFRCNSGYLVNLRKVKRVQDEDVFVDGQALKISRSRKKDFMEALLLFYSIQGGM